MNTTHSISTIISQSICDSDATFEAFKQRLANELPTRDENSASHFCVYFLPYNAQTKQVFIVHHKKSGLWISPGGHIDKGETVLEALNREVGEELGMDNFFTELPSPFLFTMTSINNQSQPCKTHYDIWVRLPTNGDDFNIDLQEFYQTKWLDLDEAQKIVTERANLQALQHISY